MPSLSSFVSDLLIKPDLYLKEVELVVVTSTKLPYHLVAAHLF